MNWDRKCRTQITAKRLNSSDRNTLGWFLATGSRRAVSATQRLVGLCCINIRTTCWNREDWLGCIVSRQLYSRLHVPAHLANRWELIVRWHCHLLSVHPALEHGAPYRELHARKDAGIPIYLNRSEDAPLNNQRWESPTHLEDRLLGGDARADLLFAVSGALLKKTIYRLTPPRNSKLNK